MLRRPHSPDDWRHGAGYTLAELLVVMVLIGVATALVLPFAVRSYGNFQLRLAADSLTILFREARSRARFGGQVYAVIFLPPEPAGRTLILVQENGRQLEHLTLPAGIALFGESEDGNWTDSLAPLHFFPNGTCEALRLDLRDAQAKHIQLELAALAIGTRVSQVNRGAE
jgi:prepilin-type N-terminal cleavage/methylation domain-containing protein